MALADRLYLTRVHAEVEGSVRFPDYDERVWRLVEETHREPDDRHAIPLTWQRFERIRTR